MTVEILITHKGEVRLTREFVRIYQGQEGLNSPGRANKMLVRSVLIPCNLSL